VPGQQSSRHSFPCGLCTLYFCPEDLFPKEACDQAIDDRKQEGLERCLGPNVELKAHPMQDSRHVPIKSLMRKLGVTSYDRPAPWWSAITTRKGSCLPLNRHIGAPAEPVVQVGDEVSANPSGS